MKLSQADILREEMHNKAQITQTIPEVMIMIDNQELPIGFTMELAEHSDILNRFAKLPEPEQAPLIEGARQVSSRQEMRNYVESMFR